MNRSPYYASPSSSLSGPPSPTISRPNKVVMQRRYRSKEGECFNTLRDIIHKLTGEGLHTRHEILKKAIELLLTRPEALKLREMRVTRLTAPYEIHSPTNFNDATLDHMDYSLQSSSSSQIWHSTVEQDAQTAYYLPQSPGQEYPFVSGTNPTVNQEGYYAQLLSLKYLNQSMYP